jgi:catechol 2,3-dioxygenase-like lactoylglutathione lyase family enzyme
VALYRERLGFEAPHVEDGFALLQRDGAEIHLWAASDDDWRTRADFAETPVCSGAESFIAGTASCRIEVGDVDALFEELRSADVLHGTSTDGPAATEWGTREFHVLDGDGNLLTFYAR